MTYIILAAGKGNNLQPLTLQYPKTSFMLDEDTTVLQRMVRTIRKADQDAEIVVVIGYKAKDVRKELSSENVIFVNNPFYEVTNSIASVWFAKDYLERENVTILNGDMVFSDEVVDTILTQNTDRPYVLADSSVNCPGAYNIVAKDGRVRVMSKKLEQFTGKYLSASKLDAVSARLIKEELEIMIGENNMYNQYFEDSLVQMIMFRGFELFCKDISGMKWAEVDNVDDLLKAQEIHKGIV